MNLKLRTYLLELAQQGHRAVLGTDLILHEQLDPDSVLQDGTRLGQTVAQAARRYGTPLAVPHMDLGREKTDLLNVLQMGVDNPGRFHYVEAPTEEMLQCMQARFNEPLAPSLLAHIESVRFIAQHYPELVTIGMAIGPFSLMTKLVADPIAPVALAGKGFTSDAEPGILLIEHCLELAQLAVLRSVQAQLLAEAKLVIVCEPAANIDYLSPKQLEAGADIFERFVIQPNLLVKRLLDGFGAELMFHNCGKLTLGMIGQIVQELKPAVLSLGSSCNLCEVAPLVSKNMILFGNLPTKQFFSDRTMPLPEVCRLTSELTIKMAATSRPFILGSECDVLHVPEAAQTISNKVHAMLHHGL